MSNLIQELPIDLDLPGALVAPGAGVSPREQVRTWLLSQPEIREFAFELRRGSILGTTAEIPAVWTSRGSGPVVLAGSASPNLDPNLATVIGGICSLFTADRDRIRSGELRFEKADQFESWIRSWYPRFDQVHDAVGIPPKAVRRVIYVCEDSIWGKRISDDTGGAVSETEATRVLREVHKEQGAPLIERWLRLGGYRGEVSVVYTSDFDRELSAVLKIWELSLERRLKTQQIDRAKVYMMYTGLWATMIGADRPAAIYEPFHHFSEVQAFTGLDWFRANPYGSERGLNAGLSALAFLPAAYAEGFTRLLPLELVPNRGNFADFEPRSEDAFMYAVNLFPAWTLKRGEAVPTEELQRRVKGSLLELFGEQ